MTIHKTSLRSDQLTLLWVQTLLRILRTSWLCQKNLSLYAGYPANNFRGSIIPQNPHPVGFCKGRAPRGKQLSEASHSCWEGGGSLPLQAPKNICRIKDLKYLASQPPSLVFPTSQLPSSPLSRALLCIGWAPSSCSFLLCPLHFGLTFISAFSKLTSGSPGVYYPQLTTSSPWAGPRFSYLRDLSPTWPGQAQNWGPQGLCPLVTKAGRFHTTPVVHLGPHKGTCHLKGN